MPPLAPSPRALREIKLRRALLKRRPRTRKRLPRQLEPRSIALAYRARILLLVREAQGLLREEVLSKLAALVEEARRERGDAWREDEPVGRRIRAVLDGLRRRFFQRHPDAELESLARDMGERTSRFQKEQLQRQIRAAVGVDVLSAEPNLRPQIDGFVEEQVSLIKSVPERLFGEVEQRVLTGLRSSQRVEDVARGIEERFGVSESRATLIARDQTLTLYAKVNESRQKAMGLNKYVWRHVNDERVRGNPSGLYPNAEPSHWDRDGKVYEWANPPEGGHPGEAILCRCFSEVYLDDLLGEL